MTTNSPDFSPGEAAGQSAFATAMALTPVAGSATAFAAHLDSHWTIGPKVHGGTLLALAVSAAARVSGRQAIAVSAHYLRAPNPGELTVSTRVLKEGRQVTVVEVEISQDGKPAVHAQVTVGALPDPAEVPIYALDDPLLQLPAAPTAEAVDVGSSPLRDIIHLSAHCDVAIDPSSFPILTGATGTPVVRMWVRPKGSEPDLAFAAFSGDVAPPVTLNLGRLGWAPTVHLTAYLRNVPAPGWLRVRASTTLIAGAWFEEDALVLDSTGRVVCQARQLAMVPASNTLPGQ